MNAILLEKIQNTAYDFVKIAKRVNISSRLRTKHSREALVCISYLRSLATNVIDDLKYISDKNLRQKDTDLEVKNDYIELQKDIKKLFAELKIAAEEKELKVPVLKKIKNIYDDFKKSTIVALQKLELILSRDDEIIKKDEEIYKLKMVQQNLLEKLQNDTQKSCNDAVKAVRGSQSNLERGLKMVTNIEQIETLLDEKNSTELNSILKEAKRGWSIAEDVNISSTSQLEFAEQVNHNTRRLQIESNCIEELVIDRHKYYAESLHIFADLTGIITSKFKKYSDYDSVIEDLGIPDNKNERATKLVSLIKKISEDANKILKKNFERISNSHYYADDEASTVSLTKEETDYFDRIIEEIEFMTETTRYPIEGSNNNITNGQILEQLMIQAMEINDVAVELGSI